MRNDPPYTKARPRLWAEFPMPAGRDAVYEWADRWNAQARDGEVKLRPEELGDVWEGLPPDTYLGLALERRTPHGSVWLLGPLGQVETHERWGNIRRFADPILRTTELPGGTDAVRHRSAELRSWYMKDICGLTVGGRPKGPAFGKDATEAMYESAIKSLVRQGKRVTYEAIAASMKPPIGASTLRKYVSDDKVLDSYPLVVARLQNGRQP